MTETWYVLESGEAVDPREVAADKNGVFRHKDGVVAMRGDVPRSRSVDPEVERQKARGKADQAKAKAEADAKAKAEADAKAMQPASQTGGYLTRDVKPANPAASGVTQQSSSSAQKGEKS